MVARFLAAALACASLAASPAEERGAHAKTAYDLAAVSYSSGVGKLDDVAEWSLRWAESDKDFAAHVERMRKLEADANKRFASGTVSKLDVVAAGYWRADAELRAAR